MPSPSRLSSLRPAIVDAALARLDMTMMPGDHMHAGNDVHYREVGESAIRCIHAAHLLANVEPPRSILDFGCGSGRVTRWLCAAYPDATVDASDVRTESLAFLAAQFGVQTWPSAVDLSQVVAPRSYDLIWVGSLLTHLPDSASRLMLRKFATWLNPAGVAVVTLHGRRARERIESGAAKMKPERLQPFLTELDTRGYGYTPPGTPLGTSANTLEWAVSALKETGCRIVTISEHSWDKHQDVVALQRLG